MPLIKVEQPLGSPGVAAQYPHMTRPRGVSLAEAGTPSCNPGAHCQSTRLVGEPISGTRRHWAVPCGGSYSGPYAICSPPHAFVGVRRDCGGDNNVALLMYEWNMLRINALYQNGFGDDRLARGDV